VAQSGTETRDDGKRAPSAQARRLGWRVALLLAFTLPPLASSAQSADAAYCAELGALAVRYISGDTAQGRGVPDLQTRAAINDCNKGNTAAGIAVLERKLRSNGFTLPKRP
jgi:hypothetical protein